MFADKVEQNADELATLECEDNGKSFEGAMQDVHMSALMMRYYGSLAMDNTGTSHMRDDMGFYKNMYCYTRKEPVGICGLITPWNYPILMSALKIAPMLASGCTGLIKLPELTPLSSLRLVELFHEVDGAVPGAINAVPGYGSTAGEAIVNHPDVRKIAFTGSTAVGKAITAKCADTMKRVTMELGGKGPLVIFGDADIQKAIGTAAIFSTANSGQFCGAATRIIVEESVYEAVVQGIAGVIQSLPVGYWREQANLGPLISEAQRQKVLGYIESGKSEGARLVCGGKAMDRSGFFVEPTVFADCTEDMKIIREEIFGPVCSIIKFKSGENSAQEALRIANNSCYGLIGGFFTNNRVTANIMERGMQCGQVGNNCYMGIGVDVPFGGYKESGTGREMGRASLENFLETKTVVVDCSTP